MNAKLPKILFLINPRSGGRRASAVIESLRRAGREGLEGYDVEELSFSQFEGQLASAQSYERVVVGGGDGTISTVVGALGESTQVGILPLGTGNDLARELGLLPLKLAARAISCPKEVVHWYQHAKALPLSVYELRYGADLASKILFINYVSFGFDAKVVADFANFRRSGVAKAIRGVWGNRFGYFGAGLNNIFNTIHADPPITITSGSETFEVKSARSVLFTNIRSIMGLGISNTVSLSHDSLLECLVIPSLLNYFTMVTHYRFPFWKPRDLGGRVEWHIRGIPKGTVVQIDGEPRIDVNSSELKINLVGTRQVLSECT